jgi:3-oxoacyl-[acyl-carrier protein] reductase
MPLDVRGQKALVTGASRGIGRAIALALADAGLDVALLARDRKALESLAREVESKGVRALALPCDVTDRDAAKRAVDRAAETFGSLHVLVNNAGVMGRGAAHDLDLETFDHVLDVNVRAVASMTRFALPHILRSGPGSRAVIHIASVAGKMTFPGGAAYCASKHAVLGFTGSVFEDVREHGVKVSAICPGFVATDMVSDRGLDMAKMIQPEDVAEAVLFVVSFPGTGCPTEIEIRPQRTPYRETR